MRATKNLEMHYMMQLDEKLEMHCTMQSNEE